MEPEMYRGFGVPSFGVLDRPIWWVKTPKGTSSERILSIDAIVRRIPQNRRFSSGCLRNFQHFFPRETPLRMCTHFATRESAIFGWT